MTQIIRALQRGLHGLGRISCVHRPRLGIERIPFFATYLLVDCAHKDGHIFGSRILSTKSTHRAGAVTFVIKSHNDGCDVLLVGHEGAEHVWTSCVAIKDLGRLGNRKE